MSPKNSILSPFGGLSESPRDLAHKYEYERNGTSSPHVEMSMTGRTVVLSLPYPEIHNNMINAGSATNSPKGIFMTGSTTTGSTATDASAYVIFADANSSPTIDNNIVPLRAGRLFVV